MVGGGESEYSTSSSSCSSDVGSSSLYSDSSSSSSDYADTQLAAAERLQIEACFKALSTQVYVCGCLANLYERRGSGGRWTLRHTGVPVVLLDTGLARSRRSKGITLVLAERGSCLALWHDKIDNLSSYRAAPAWHTLCASQDHSLRIGLSFSCRLSAEQLWNHIDRLTSDPENISLSVPGRKSKKAPPQPRPLPAKANISQPCCFQHVTSVGTTDVSRYASLQTLLPSTSTQKN